METALIVANQTLVMFIYMLLGFVLRRTGKLTAQGSKGVSSLLVQLVIPTVILNTFCVESSPEMLIRFAQGAVAGALALAISIAVSKLLFKNPTDQFASSFSNAGFMGIPLVQAAFGSDGVFYVIGMITFLNILQWTYGAGLLTGKSSSTSVKGLLLNPMVIAAIVGFVLFITGLGVKLPSALSTAIGGVASLNGPVAMIILGVYLADTDMKALVRSLSAYKVSAVRLVLIPLLTALAFKLLPFPGDIKLAVFITAAAPVGVNVAVCSEVNGLDYSYACRSVVLSTLMSIISMPLMILLAQGL